MQLVGIVWRWINEDGDELQRRSVRGGWVMCRQTEYGKKWLFAVWKCFCCGGTECHKVIQGMSISRSFT